MVLSFQINRDYPDINGIFYTTVDYGSCTACDSIQAAWSAGDIDTMIQSYMTLSLHLIQNMKCYGDIEKSYYYKKSNNCIQLLNDGFNKSENHDKLILKKKRFDYICELTEDMDKYIKFENHASFNTYIYNSKIDKYWLIRFPGATRGRITVDEDEIITNIEIYNDQNNIYKPEIEDILKEKYIGMKMVRE